ncbi:uncharacterized protein LOC107639023 isoform X1 [Arachis ipaensis]|uniref:uncharacterized protein LOC107639023 isoform X1 n=2 Tax=Arachis ipaensis TaxID=130454 RepID=UPI000A2B6B20|nr:uncharacterized protein LOC107639023 isoform X1 [Arachis ipaensis]
MQKSLCFDLVSTVQRAAVVFLLALLDLLPLIEFPVLEYRESILRFDLREDLKTVLAKIESLLAGFGFGWETVVYIHLYIDDMSKFSEANETYVKFITPERVFPLGHLVALGHTVSGGASAELELALKNCEAVAKCSNCSISTSAIMFVVYCSKRVSSSERHDMQEKLETILTQMRIFQLQEQNTCKALDPIVLYVLVPNLPKRNPTISEGENQREDIQAMNIILNPGLAFGIGDHPTTKLCLLLLHDRIKGGEYILDYGTGTGILAIAALKFGAAFAVGVDIDSQAIASASKNATLNNIRPDKLQLHLIASQTSSSCRDDWPSRVVEGENAFEIDKVTHKDKYDVVIANIFLNPMLNLADQIIFSAKPGAIIGLSGILSEQVQNFYKNIHYS